MHAGGRRDRVWDKIGDRVGLDKRAGKWGSVNRQGHNEGCWGRGDVGSRRNRVWHKIGERVAGKWGP